MLADGVGRADAARILKYEVSPRCDVGELRVCDLRKWGMMYQRELRVGGEGAILRSDAS